MPPSYVRTALSPRMLVLLVLLLGAAAVCARLGVWQLDRAELRGDAEQQERRAAIAEADPLPLQDVLEPQSSFRGELVGEKVVASGAFEPDQVLVPGRALDGRTGYLVVAPLRVDDAVLAVVRGWVAEPEAPEPPTDAVEVVGFLQVGEGAGIATDLPAGQVDAVSPAELVNRWGGPIYSGYLVEASAPDGVQTLPPPTLAGGGLNIQNLAYALQWWIFGGFAVLLWARMVRDETRLAREEIEGGPDDDGPGGPGGGGAGDGPGTGPVAGRDEEDVPEGAAVSPARTRVGAGATP